MKVLFNADDFGLTKGITDGIIEAYQKGVVRSTTLMMNGLATEYAVKHAKLHPGLKVGVHLVLSYGKPLSACSKLTNKEGNFKFTSIMGSIPDIVEVKNEWQAQIEAFLNTGLELHHIDSHHHVHGWAPLKEIIIELAEAYGVPIRYTDSLKNHPDILLTDTLWTGFYKEGVSNNIFSDIKALNAASVEIMTHPAYADDDLRSVSSYVEMREKELEILTNIKIPDWAEMM